MEMPIQVMVVLFVVIIVGSLIIVFSQNVLNTAQQNLPQKNNPGFETQIAEVAGVSDAQIASLVDDCYKQSFGKALNSWNCYIIHSSADYAISAAGISAALTSAGKDPNIVSVPENGATRTVFVSWNFENAKVEVKK